jgi:ribonucleoside-triphosphate reductase (thioredoxin)
MFVKERFQLAWKSQDVIRSIEPPFGYNGLGEFLFFRTYSRVKPDLTQENWADCIIRAVNGTFSIRKDWYIKNHIHWDESFWQDYALQFGASMCRMEWLPPGRGLWAMGTDFIYERGSMALNNCGYSDLGKNLGFDLAWMMDALMCGVGVGFGPIRDPEFRLYKPVGTFDYEIPDTREGWAQSEKLLVDAYTQPNQKLPKFKYDKIRGPGLPIKGFGGISSGPAPLIKLHEDTLNQFELYGSKPEYDVVYLKTNLANLIGVAVVAGNVRRSAELAKGKITDPVFKDLKNYEKFPEREAFGWMSNNSVELEDDVDFDSLGEIAERVKRNGEPGYINRRNMPFGRIGKKMKGLRKDKAVAFNPCAEIPLEDKELCNIAETFPTVCDTPRRWLMACEHATFYCSTVSLLPTHQSVTNKVLARNRRIGVGLVDYTGWKHEHGVYKVTKFMREGYKTVRRVNKYLNREAGVPESIRVTTVKPGGTVPKLPGKTSGVGHPTFDYTIRRIRVAKNSPVHPILVKGGLPYEEDFFDKYTDVFEWPIRQGPSAPADKVSIWEQAINLVVVQREWSDNAVSNTLYFRPKWALIESASEKERCEAALICHFGHAALYHIQYHKKTEYLVPDKYKVKINWAGNILESIKIYEYDPQHEEDAVEPVLSAIAPLTKSVSVLPHSPKGAYRQMPEEGITQTEYLGRLARLGKFDWTQLSGSDGVDERFCTADVCEMPINTTLKG